MSAKRPRDDRDDSAVRKKQKKGFAVGPANLPDGTYRRKVQKIKKNLIEKAKLKKQYAKVREQELANYTPRQFEDVDDAADKAAAGKEEEPAEQSGTTTMELHPDRQQRLERSDESEDEDEPARIRPRNRKPKPQPFAREAAQAQKRKQEAEARQKAREEAEAERQRKIAERERFRKAMAKARSGRDGKRRLGREGPVLLEKVKKIVQ